MPTASFSTLQGDVGIPPCGTQIVLSLHEGHAQRSPRTAPHGTAADNQAPGRDGDPASGRWLYTLSLLRHNISLFYRRVYY